MGCFRRYHLYGYKKMYRSGTSTDTSCAGGRRVNIDTLAKDMSILARLLHDHGQFHDSRIVELLWNPTTRRVTLIVDDLDANFRGFPEYSGPIPGKLMFENVHSLNVSVETLEDSQFKIYAMELGPIAKSCSVFVKLSPTGLIEIGCSNMTVSRKER